MLPNSLLLNNLISGTYYALVYMSKLVHITVHGNYGY